MNDQTCWQLWLFSRSYDDSTKKPRCGQAQEDLYNKLWVLHKAGCTLHKIILNFCKNIKIQIWKLSLHWGIVKHPIVFDFIFNFSLAHSVFHSTPSLVRPMSWPISYWNLIAAPPTFIPTSSPMLYYKQGNLTCPKCQSSRKLEDPGSHCFWFVYKNYKTQYIFY